MCLIKDRRDYSNKNTFSDNLKSATNKPSEEITETDFSYHYELKIPGYIQDDFNFYIRDNDLVLTTGKIKKVEANENEDTKFKKHPYFYPSAYSKRHFRLPNNIIRDEILVDYKDEILSFDLIKLKDFRE